MNKKQFVIVGLGTFGENVAKYLTEKGAQVIAIDKNEKKIQDIAPFVTQALTADATDEKFLKSLNLKDIDVGIVAIGESLEDSILVTLHMRELGVKKIVVKCINQLHARISAKLGADRIIYPELEMAKRVAENLISPNILEEIELSPEYNIVELVVPKRFIGKTIKEAKIRSEYNLTVIAIKKKIPYLTDSGESNFKEEINIAPLADEEINEGDTLIVIGKDSDIERIKKE